jgi:peptidoglycan/xylan/chitin deacetylase (PgdA/CDA1 family)
VSAGHTWMRFRLAAGSAAIRALGLPAVARRRYGWFPTVLTYHGVHDGSLPSDLYAYNTKHVSATDFARQLAWLRRHYEIVSLAEVERIVREHRWRPRVAAITFDDGYENNLTVAWPILRRAGLPATLFVTVDVIERQRPYEHDRIELALRCTDRRALTLSANGERRSYSLADPSARAATVYAVKEWIGRLSGRDRAALFAELMEQCWRDEYLDQNRAAYQPLQWDQVRRLSDEGFEIGSHTLTHPHLSRADDHQVQRELVGSRRRLEEMIGRPVTRLSYPYGSYDDRTVVAARDAGYSSACTSRTWYLGQAEDPYTIPRLSVVGGAPFNLFVASTTRALRLIGRGRGSGSAD